MSFNLDSLVKELVILRERVDHLLEQIKLIFPLNTKIPKSKGSGIRLVFVADPRPGSDGSDGNSNGGASMSPRNPGRGAGAPGGLNGLVAWEAIEKYLLTKGKPARTTEIASALVLRGFQSSSTNLRGFVYQVLRKKPSVFSQVKRGFWGLKRWDGT